MNEETLFHLALEKPPSERSTFLDSACAGDAGLRRRVETLLEAHDDPGSFLQKPVLESTGMNPGEMTQALDGQSATPVGVTTPNQTEPGKTSGDTDLSFLSPSTRTDSIGRLGQYEILQVVGKGGFGTVLKAFDENLHRIVAIKVLSPAFAANGAARKRFIREARTAAAIKNEHVVGIYDVKEEANPPYLAMEMIDGISLQEKIDKQGALGVKEILRIGVQMAEGLASAHKQSLVHRDIKPANILLENGVERVKITDFGLARAVDDASVTQSGTVAGTPMYMSPEQAEGLPIDHRSDLFSLGTVLYAMCTGHPPFRASGTHAVLKRVIDASPRPIREINNEIPEWLCDIIARLHAKKPEDRFQSATEVAELLGQRLADVQAGRTIEWPRRAADTMDAIPAVATEGSSDLAAAQRLVVYPALGLFITGVLYWLTIPFFVITRFEIGVPDDQQSFLWRTMGLIPILAGFGLMFGAAKLKRLENYGLAWFAALLPLALLAEKLVGLLNTQFIMTLGDWTALPFGLWAILVLSRRDVRAAFAAKDRESHRVPLLLRGWLFAGVAGALVAGVTIAELSDFTHFFHTPHHWIDLSVDDANVTIRIVPAIEGVHPEKAFAEMDAAQRGHRVPRGHGRIRLAEGSYWFGAERGGKIVYYEKVVVDRSRDVVIEWDFELFKHRNPIRLPPLETGWVQLFNGKDLTGWNSFGTGKWKIDGGILVGTGADARLAHARAFQDFHLRARVKFNEAAYGTFSFRSEDAKMLTAHGEVIIGNEAHARLGKSGSAHLYYNPNLENESRFDQELVPVGSWFDLDIIVRGKEIVAKVNGVTTAQIRAERMPARGSICLNLYQKGSVIEFEKIEIKELPPEEPAWVKLFNGKDLTGWRPNDKWQVADGILSAKGPAFLHSKKTYRDFHCRIKARFNETAIASIGFRGIPNEAHGEVAIGNKHASGQKTGSFHLFSKNKPSEWARWNQELVSSGNWFDLDLIVQGKKVTVKVNGTTTATFESERMLDDGLLQLNAYEAGTLLEFGSIEIKELPPEEPAWVKLFNGKDTLNWKTHSRHRGNWQVSDGQLVCSQADKGSAWLFSERIAFKDYLLRAEFKVERGAAALVLNANYNDDSIQFAPLLEPEFDVPPGDAIWLSPPKSAAPPASMWQVLEVSCVGTRRVVKLNDKVIEDTSAAEKTPQQRPIALHAGGKDVLVRFRSIDVKELSPIKLPETAEQVLPALAGAWKGEYTQKIYGGKPDVKILSAVAVNDWVAGQKWMRQRVLIGNEGFQSVTTYEPGTNAFRDFFFHSRGTIFAPSTGRWDSPTRTLTWTNLPDASSILLMTLRFVDADTFTGEILIRDKQGKTVFEMSSLMKRTTENITIDDNVSTGPLPKEMAVLDRLVGDWQTTGVIKDAKNPDGYKSTWQSSARKILGGRVIATQRFGDDESYSLATFDTFSKAYGRWSFRDDRNVLEYHGLWDEQNQTLKWHWSGKDGSQNSNAWPLLDANRRDWHVLRKDALGKTTYEVKATSVRQSEPAWVSLFNGKDLTGWKVPEPAKNWKVDRGELVCNEGIVLLHTERADYRNFHFRIEAQAVGTITCGQFFRAGIHGSVHLLDGYSATVGVFPGKLDAWQKGRAKPLPGSSTRSPSGTWITQEVIANGKRLIVKVNGNVTTDVTHDDYAEGFLALRVLNGEGEVRIRKIEVKELPSPPKHEFQPLFNGKDLTGWTTNGDPKDWEVSGGFILCKGTDGEGASRVSALLCTVKEYDNYVLKMQWRCPRPANEAEIAKSSGHHLYLHMGPKGPVPHVRFSQNNDGSGALLGQFGGQFKLEKPAGKVELVFPDKSPQLKIPGNARAFGEWNDLVITARDGRLTIESNGEHQVTAAECNPRKGHIGMEAIGAEFHYRNVEIKELPPAPPEPEFQPLFNGKNLNGWELPSADADKWSVESGEIVRKPGAIPNVLMTRRRDYGNFHLRAEAKVSDKGTGGVQLRVNEFSGYQADINGSILKLLAKGGPAVLAKSAAPLVPPDTWFTLDVIAEGPIVTVQVNGVKSAEIRSADSRIGPIGLAAGANTELRFRKVEIKELTPAIASWKSLFNGKDLDGWNIPNKMDGLWTVDFGVLKGTAKKDKAYQLYSQSEFKDFHLRAKTQVKPGRAGTVYVRIRDGAWKGVGVKLHHLTARDLEVSLFSALNPVRTLATKRCTLGADQWFDLEIIAVGPRLEVRVDGAPAGEYTFTPEDAAKHHSEGGIVFEVADPYSELSFSKIEIQELPSVNR